MAIDWNSSMSRTFEFYTVIPGSWSADRKIDTIKSATITRDSSTSLLESATFETTETFDECYIRIYLVCVQNGETYKFCLGTFLVQSPSISFNGITQSISMTGYSPLLELDDNLPPFGLTTRKNQYIIANAKQYIEENCRVPVIAASTEDKLDENIVCGVDDSWLKYCKNLLSYGKHSITLDEMSRIKFEPDKTLDSMQASWEFNDDNSSILYPEVKVDKDIYGIPNVIELIYSSSNLFSKVVVENDNPNSPVSTVSRGRRVVYRDTSPSVTADNQSTLNSRLGALARTMLRNASTLTYTITYTHGYCPVRVGDCVRLNYTLAGLQDVRALVTSQTITCEPGCPVEETAIYTKNLWEV